MKLERRLEALERRYEALHPPVPLRIFRCDGTAEDGGPSIAESPRPGRLPAGAVWSVRICSCVAEGEQECQRLDELQAEGLPGELLIRQYAGVELAEV